MFIQGIENVYEVDWDGIPASEGGKIYGDVFNLAEKEFSKWNFELADTAILLSHFNDAEHDQFEKRDRRERTK